MIWTNKRQSRASTMIPLSLWLPSAASGCVAFPDLGARLDAWRGKDEKTLTARWGAPDRSHTNKDGSQVFTYVYVRQEIYGSPGFLGDRRHFGTALHTAHFDCRVNFSLDAQGVIQSALFEGDVTGCNALIRPYP